MPSETFKKLSTAKQRRVLEAAKEVFLEKPYEKITITGIVRRAKIPRGSFYQYFEGLDDLYRHLFDTLLEDYERHVLASIDTPPPGVFAFFKDSFERDYRHMRDSDHFAFMQKFFKERSAFSLGHDYFHQRRDSFHRKILTALDTCVIAHHDEDSRLKLFRLLTHIKMKLINKIVREDATYEEARRDYLFYVGIIEKGSRATEHE